MNYSYEQIGTVCATFECTPEVRAGQVCRMFSNNCVGKAENESIFAGVVMSKRDSCASVIMRGFVTVSFTGSAPTVGYHHLLSNGQGGVCLADDGKNCLIVSVDHTNKTVTFLL